ncbi:hypothetical protein TWF696_005311 [Orbilia brochopaga]|uniref:SET domain-containing protein n=1 Tax=Orbilia brochopaga TaxID=3140254 RepID=A0AAV9V0S6_9PEZI
MHSRGDGGLQFSREEFEWGWAVVNTRTIYYRPKQWAKVPAEDCMTMCPFIDYYNHDWRAEQTCLVSFSTDGLRVTTQKSYAPGEEVFVTYGNYNNDHLLVEYGFTLPHNGSDNINVDAWVLPKLSPAKQDILADLSFHGAYFLDATSTCYRTLTALRLAVVDEASLPRDGQAGLERYVDFVRLVQGEMDEDEYARRYSADEARLSALMDGIVCEVEESATSAIAALASLTSENGVFAAVERWRQTIAVLEAHKSNKH